eukprot:354895-Chlamydomonas_euryale.AAC.4
MRLQFESGGHPSRALPLSATFVQEHTWYLSLLNAMQGRGPGPAPGHDQRPADGPVPCPREAPLPARPEAQASCPGQAPQEGQEGARLRQPSGRDRDENGPRWLSTVVNESGLTQRKRRSVPG